MPYPATPTYWLEPTREVAYGLRRYHSGSGLTCATGYHSALRYLGRSEVERDADTGHLATYRSGIAHGDDRWPTTCEHGCGYRFTPDDVWQEWQEVIYRRSDTGAEYVLHQQAPATELGIPAAPPGACWDAWWMPARYKRPDGICLVVRLPNGHDWMVDTEAGNCTRKGQPHACWVRHGRPQDCQVTVDKNGDTCAAGAGSIAALDYHGFLHHGVLTAG